jgi:hypothetical protein
LIRREIGEWLKEGERRERRDRRIVEGRGKKGISIDMHDFGNEETRR